jgi:hypothetical protein
MQDHIALAGKERFMWSPHAPAASRYLHYATCLLGYCGGQRRNCLQTPITPLAIKSIILKMPRNIKVNVHLVLITYLSGICFTGELL